MACDTWLTSGKSSCAARCCCTARRRFLHAGWIPSTPERQVTCKKLNLNKPAESMRDHVSAGTCFPKNPRSAKLKRGTRPTHH
eukprot:3460222-Amphidinium_carterae.1